MTEFTTSVARLGNIGDKLKALSAKVDRFSAAIEQEIRDIFAGTDSVAPATKPRRGKVNPASTAPNATSAPSTIPASTRTPPGATMPPMGDQSRANGGGG